MTLSTYQNARPGAHGVEFATATDLHIVRGSHAEDGLYLATIGRLGQRSGLYLSKADAERLRDELLKAFPLPVEAPDPEPAPVPEPLKVGDRVRVIDGGGSRTGRVGDEGVVEETGYGAVVRVRLATGIHAGRVSGRYARRWEKIPTPAAPSPVPLAEWEKALRDGVVVTAPKFKKGDRVRRVGPHNLDGGTRDQFGKAPGFGHESRLGWTATVEADQSGSTVSVRWDASGRTSSIHPSALALVRRPVPKPEPKFKVGDVVAVADGASYEERFQTNPYPSPTLGLPATNARGKVTAVEGDRVTFEDDGTNMHGFRFVGSRTLPESRLRPSTGTHSDMGYLPFVKPDVVGDVIGQVVYVTGKADPSFGDHDFEIGTEVEIKGDDYTLDGSYWCEATDGSESDYVGAGDLSIEKPAPVYKVGDLVRIVNDGAGLTRHYLPVGSIAEVVRVPANQTTASLTLKGVCVWPDSTCVDTQQVRRASFEPVS